MLRGTKRPVPQRTIDLRASIHNRFDIEVLDAETGELRQNAQALNLICDVFWARMFNIVSGAWKPLGEFNYILYGGGSGTPSASDTTLFSQLGYRSTPSRTYTPNEKSGLVTAQAVATLQAEDNVGDTITEVGIGYDTTHCVTHAMLTDMNGNPISITKTATDVIKIYATFFVHWSSAGWYNGSVFFKSGLNGTSMLMSLIETILANSQGHTLYFCRKTSARCSGWTANTIVEYVNATLNSAAKTAAISFRYAADQVNLPIRFIFIANVHKANSGDSFFPLLQLIPGSWYTPGAITGEAVGTGDGSTTGFQTAFPVKTAGTVYIDGAAASGATMRTGPADGTTMQQWFNQLDGSDASALTDAGAPIYRLNSSVNSSGRIEMTLAAGAMSFAFENPFSSMGISKFMVFSGHTNSRTLKVQASDDLTTWTDCGTVTTNGNTAHELAVDAAYQKKKYFRFVNTSSGSETFYIWNAYAAVADPEHNISFSTPPAAGAVITADYTPDCIAKDSNHVFDLNIVLTFGEYMEE